MKKPWQKIIWLILSLMLAAAWWGWQQAGMQLLQPGMAWC